MKIDEKSCRIFSQLIRGVRYEAEDSLRLAFYLIEKGLAASDVDVAIDGAQVPEPLHKSLSELEGHYKKMITIPKA